MSLTQKSTFREKSQNRSHCINVQNSEQKDLKPLTRDDVPISVSDKDVMSFGKLEDLLTLTRFEFIEELKTRPFGVKSVEE